MCGIAGSLAFHRQPVSEERLRFMAKALAHRGPDGEGIWSQRSIGLVHRRLAIIDLSERGLQPMSDQRGRVRIVFNGEIYNYQMLRAELEVQGRVFVSTSDTEVLLHLYERDGERMLQKLRGMFAFALWDEERERLFFARDRLGKKPFFYQLNRDGFSFASEIPALFGQEHPLIDWTAIRTFIGLQYVPSPQTGFRGIHSLSAGFYGLVEKGAMTLHRYDEVSREPKFSGTEQEAAERVRALMEESVRLRLIADVPVGAFLSGGVDSSIVTALAAQLSSSRIQTFTMGFSNFGFDERKEAASFAALLGTDHRVFEAHPEDVVALVDTFVSTYAAPYADSSGIPTWLLAKEAHPYVKVVLAGDGGDELFGGYRRYQFFLRATRWQNPLGLLFADILSLFTTDPRYKRFAETIRGIKTSYAHGYAALFTGGYFSPRAESLLLQPEFVSETAHASAEKFVLNHFHEAFRVEGALDFDLSSYLIDDLNVKMDRATMAHALEARIPFLDQELVQFAAKLPLSFLFTSNESKKILRMAFDDLLPAEIFTRPKKGFQLPLAQWFRQDLRHLFVERCLETGVALHRVCRPERVRYYFQENDRGKDHGNRLWMLLVLATWLERYKG